MIAVLGNVACVLLTSLVVRGLLQWFATPEITDTRETLVFAGIHVAGAIVGAVSILVGFVIADRAEKAGMLRTGGGWPNIFFLIIGIPGATMIVGLWGFLWYFGKYCLVAAGMVAPSANRPEFLLKIFG